MKCGRFVLLAHFVLFFLLFPLYSHIHRLITRFLVYLLGTPREQDIAQLTKAIPAAELAARKCRLVLDAAAQQEAALAERLRAAQAALQPADDEVARVAELKQELVRWG